MQVAQRLSEVYNGAENRPKTRRRQMLEYPGAPPPKPLRWTDGAPAALSHASLGCVSNSFKGCSKPACILDSGDEIPHSKLSVLLVASAVPQHAVPEQRQAVLNEVMTGRDQLTADDYILPYIDDSDSEQDMP